jgi:hypothetical protein
LPIVAYILLLINTNIKCYRIEELEVYSCHMDDASVDSRISY